MSAVSQTATLLIQAVFSGRYTFCALLAPALLAFGVFFNAKLQSLDRGWLEWSPFHVKANVALLPIKVRLVWLPYSLLLAFCMPFLALIEEWLFRAGTTNWVRGLLWGTIAFGLFHLFSFVTVRMTIYLMLVGAIFVQLYMLDGIIAVFVLHSVYNLTALALLVATRKRGLPGVLEGASISRRRDGVP
jgi:Type II CAAX prenyl endopeptidase Rce1-like